ncbi:hypothetical protein SAMN05421740_107144 [Parapedobacter koreensis]|uniref:Cytochrome C and Quinol oxidase polypeptide I n=2 Tax=Parapedobacter koreensis TaxID=332977 RepID=A0A1H7RJ39_9SPHI|nr:hypothetical protein SAMN05421740_107144 [Parapedobacter koreensis]
MVLGTLSLLLVAASGLLMRMKFLTALPAINQKFLLHAHSHFAFSGWISHALMVLIAAAVCGTGSRENLPRRYQVLIAANLLAAYGMLVSFFLQGYGFYSICASTLTVALSYIFAVRCWRDTARPILDSHTRRWLRAALFFLVLSSVGTFFLAYLMASHNTDSKLQLTAVYFFLHFQYNGWFFFACMGLFHHWLRRCGIVAKHPSFVFWAFAWSCIPTYFLSIPWWDMPGWLYTIVVGAAAMQAIAWGIGLHSLPGKLIGYTHRPAAVAKGLLIGTAIAATIKILLQGLSAIPSLSQLVYGFRPIVIGYLHLVLLAIITLFIMAYAYMNESLLINRRAVVSTVVLATGIVLNEVLLFLQGVSGLMGIFIGHIPYALAWAAGIMVVGLAGLIWSQYISTSPISS